MYYKSIRSTLFSLEVHIKTTLIYFNKEEANIDLRLSNFFAKLKLNFKLKRK